VPYLGIEISDFTTDATSTSHASLNPSSAILPPPPQRLPPFDGSPNRLQTTAAPANRAVTPLADHVQHAMTPDPSAAPTHPLARSPHPYHRQRLDLLQPVLDSGSGPSLPPSARISSPSDSGTEADDERPLVLLKGLPAPPLRPRKGLNDNCGSGAEAALSSPLLTPSYLDEERRRRPSAERSSTRSPSRSRTRPNEESARLVEEKYRRRRRAELLRRGLETVCLGGAGCLNICRTPAALRTGGSHGRDLAWRC
jgi:hypothetical protein